MSQVKMKYCQSCGARIPIEAQICPKCGQWTVPPVSPVEVTSDQEASISWVQKMGADGLLALLGYFLIVISVFLPWATISGVLGQIQVSGLEVAQGVPGIQLLVFAVLGGVATVFVKKKTKWIGFSDFVIGIIFLWITHDEMNTIASIAEQNTTDVWTDLGSGGYLAIAAALLVIVAGLITVVRARSTRRPVEAFTAQAKPSTGLQGSFPLNEQTVDKQVSEASAGVYALGPKRGKAFYVHFVGGSDTDVRAGLKEYIGRYDRFKFATVDSPKAAFIKECELYHAFGGPEGKIDNKNHPERPQGAMWLCPECSIFRSHGADQTQREATTTGKRFCVECGAELPANIRFCTGCGKAVAT